MVHFKGSGFYKTDSTVQPKEEKPAPAAATPTAPATTAPVAPAKP